MQLSRGVRIGRPFGIPLSVHGSWLPAALLLALHLFRGSYDGLDTQLAAALAGLTIFVFFLCVVAHELGHAAVARSLGLPAPGITLFFFGGVSRITKEPARPLEEVVVALAGPLVSIGIGGLFLAVASTDGLLGGAASDEPAVRALLTLGAANVALAVVNLLPAFPLDGGRVVRAVLWAVGKDAHGATLRAGRAGQVTGGLLAAAGLIVFIATGSMSLEPGSLEGLWLAVVGGFLVALGTGARRSAAVARALEGQAAGEWARPFDGTVAPGDPVARRSANGIAPLAVTDKGRLTGVLPSGFIASDDGRPAREQMVPWNPSLAFESSEPLTGALERMARQTAGVLVVLDARGAVVGVLDHEGVRRRLERAPRAAR